MTIGLFDCSETRNRRVGVIFEAASSTAKLEKWTVGKATAKVVWNWIFNRDQTEIAAVQKFLGTITLPK